MLYKSTPRHLCLQTLDFFPSNRFWLYATLLMHDLLCQKLWTLCFRIQTRAVFFFLCNSNFQFHTMPSIAWNSSFDTMGEINGRMGGVQFNHNGRMSKSCMRVSARLNAITCYQLLVTLAVQRQFTKWRLSYQLIEVLHSIPHS